MNEEQNYHRETRYIRHQIPPHSLDWGNQPATEKRYPGKRTIPLPETDLSETASGPFLNDLMQPQQTSPSFPRIDIGLVSDLLIRSCCFSARARQAGGWFYFRTTASAGALYPTEIYIVANAVENLKSGLYHYHPGDRRLTELRSGNFFPFPAEAPGIVSDPNTAASILVTGIFFRSSWKYRQRAYRYVLLDAGHQTANIVLALRSLGLPYTLQENFIDEKANEFLGVDPHREACLAVVHLHGGEKPIGPPAAAFPPAAPETIAASRSAAMEKIEPRILDAHRSGENPVPSRNAKPAASGFETVLSGEPQPIGTKAPLETELRYLPALMQRRSRRNFIPRPLDPEIFRRFAGLLAQTRHFEPPVSENILQVGILPANVPGYPARIHLLDRRQRVLIPTQNAADSHAVATVCLNQDWLSNAALYVLLLGKPREIQNQWGGRGYRYAMMQAGRIGQTVYLAATATGIGCCGIGAFYDDEAAGLFHLPDEVSLLYLLAAGPVKRR